MAEYIEREKLLRDINHYHLSDGKFQHWVEVQPAADVAPVRHGRWLPQVVLGQKAWDCSECKTLGSPHWKWCPVCGCKMNLED